MNYTLYFEYFKHFSADCFWDSRQCTSKVTSFSSTTKEYCAKRFKMCIDNFLEDGLIKSLSTVSSAQFVRAISTEDNMILSTHNTFSSQSSTTPFETTKQKIYTQMRKTTATTTFHTIKPYISTTTADNPNYDYTNVQIIGVG